MGSGLVIFLTGLSGAGKSTIASLVVGKLRQEERKVVLLDGDAVREHLSADLGFSREDRIENIRRIASLAADIAKDGGVAVCAAIAPYEICRRVARKVTAGRGQFVLVYVATPLEVCERRDRKNLYARARLGEIPNFTGVTDPYEKPIRSDLTIDATVLSPLEASSEILDFVRDRGLLNGVHSFRS